MPPAGFEYVKDWNAERSEKGWWHSFELPDGKRIEGVCSLRCLRFEHGLIGSRKRADSGLPRPSTFPVRT